jgi:hypothetical protein
MIASDKTMTTGISNDAYYEGPNTDDEYIDISYMPRRVNNETERAWNEGWLTPFRTNNKVEAFWNYVSNIGANETRVYETDERTLMEYTVLYLVTFKSLFLRTDIVNRLAPQNATAFYSEMSIKENPTP